MSEINSSLMAKRDSVEIQILGLKLDSFFGVGIQDHEIIVYLDKNNASSKSDRKQLYFFEYFLNNIKVERCSQMNSPSEKKKKIKGYATCSFCIWDSISECHCGKRMCNSHSFDECIFEDCPKKDGKLCLECNDARRDSDNADLCADHLKMIREPSTFDQIVINCGYVYRYQ